MRRLAGWMAMTAAVLALAGLAAPAQAQVGAGTMAGDVVDGTGAAVPGASVTATAVGTRRARTVVSGVDGAYVVAGVLPGEYRVEVEMTGFRRHVRVGVRLATGETIGVDLQLEVGGPGEAVTVTADAPLLRSEHVGPRPRRRQPQESSSCR